MKKLTAAILFTFLAVFNISADKPLDKILIQRARMLHIKHSLVYIEKNVQKLTKEIKIIEDSIKDPDDETKGELKISRANLITVQLQMIELTRTLEKVVRFFEDQKVRSMYLSH